MSVCVCVLILNDKQHNVLCQCRVVLVCVCVAGRRHYSALEVTDTNLRAPQRDPDPNVEQEKGAWCRKLILSSTNGAKIPNILLSSFANGTILNKTC